MRPSPDFSRSALGHALSAVTVPLGLVTAYIPLIARASFSLTVDGKTKRVRMTNEANHRRIRTVLIAAIWLSASTLCLPVAFAQDASGIPVFKITPVKSTIKFAVKASVAIEGTFDKWDATLTFTSNHAEDGVLDVKIQAASVDTGSGMKDGKLKSKDFFDAEQDPYITFHSTKIVQTSPTTFDIQGTFTIRGVSRPETLNLTLSGKGTGHGEVKGTMAFDRKDYGMNSGIPFIKIADRVEVSVDLLADRVSGPPLIYKQ
jgi:polyisoprenoid-binding protein YceI